MVYTTICDVQDQAYAEYFLGHTKSVYHTKKEAAKREIYQNKVMKYLTFLDYSFLEKSNNSIEEKLEQKDREIAYLQKELRENKDARIETANMYQQIIERLEKVERNQM